MSTHYYRFTRGAPHPQRSRLLERLLARADGSRAVMDWRRDAFGAIAPKSSSMPGVAAAALYADRGAVDGASVFMATPVHYVAEMSNVRLPADGILSLLQPEADALAVDFNRGWNDAGIRMLAGRSAGLFCVADAALKATTHDPEDALGRHIENHLPSGAAAPRLRQLMSEIEMWLFEHAVNRTRLSEGAAAVSGLWLWGGGPALRSLPAVDGWAVGEDPFFKAFAAQAEGSRAEDLGWTAHTSATSGVAVTAAVPGTDAWRDVESRWLERSVAELTSGRLARLELSAGNRVFSVGPRWSWRLWRRRRPWWESFA